MSKHKVKPQYVFLARAERDITGGVTLHLIENQTRVELHEGDEFFTVHMTVNPFNSRRAA